MNKYCGLVFPTEASNLCKSVSELLLDKAVGGNLLVTFSPPNPPTPNLHFVFHYKYQSYKYERNTAGKPASMWVGVEPISTTLSAMQILHGGMNDFQQSHLNDDIVY